VKLDDPVRYGYTSNMFGNASSSGSKTNIWEFMMGKKLIIIFICLIFFIVMENHSYSAKINVYDNSNNGYYILMGIIFVVGVITAISLLIQVFKKVGND
jgi:uncharacterized membrane protein affecting hemolysin expression